MKCLVCGKEFTNNYYSKNSEYYGLCGSPDCFEKRFWDLTLDGNEIIINGKCYHIGKEPSKLELSTYRERFGFGGVKYKIKKFGSDEIIITHNLRANGRVPEDRNLKDNAKFLGVKNSE